MTFVCFEDFIRALGAKPPSSLVLNNLQSCTDNP